MTIDSFTLQIVQNTLVDLGYTETARKLVGEIEAKNCVGRDVVLGNNSTLFVDWLYRALVDGLYGEAVAVLDSGSESGSRTAATAMPPAELERAFISYFVKRAQFLDMVLAYAYESIAGDESQLLDYLRLQLLPLLDRIHAQSERSLLLSALSRITLSTEIFHMLTRERESGNLLQLVMQVQPHGAVAGASAVFKKSNLLAVVPRRGGDVFGHSYSSDSAIIRSVLLKDYLGLYFKEVKNASDAAASAVAAEEDTALYVGGLPHNYLRLLLEQASAFHKLISPYYLPPRDSSLGVSDNFLPPFEKPINDFYKKSFPVAPIQTLNYHTNEVWVVKFSPLGKYLVTGSRDGKMIIYDVTSYPVKIAAILTSDEVSETSTFIGSPIKPAGRKREPVQQRGVCYCSWDESESYIVSCGMDTIVRIWDVRGLHHTKATNVASGSYSVSPSTSSFSTNTPSNSSKTVANDTPRRITRSLANDLEPDVKLMTCFTVGDNIRVRSCKFIPQTSNSYVPKFVVASPDKALKVYDIYGNEVFDFFYDTTENEERDEKMEVGVSKESVARSGSTGSSTPAPNTTATLSVPALSGSPTLSSPNPTKFLQKNFNRVIDFAISPDGKFLITANNDKLVQFYSIPDLTDPYSKSVKICSINLKGKLNSTSVSANGKYFLVNVSQELQLWDISDLSRSSKPVLTRKFIGHRVDENVIRACFGYLDLKSGTEELILSGSAEGYIYIWKLQTGQLITRVKGHLGVCNSVDWNRFSSSPTSSSENDYGKLWCSVGDDHLARIWGPPKWNH